MKPILSLIVLLVFLSPQWTAAAAPPARSANPLAPAVAELVKEYQAAMKKGEGLREKCDYFAKAKPEGVTPEIILAALEKPQNSDPRADAYVKWQFLSAIDGKFTAEQKARALKIYRAAAKPASHPGLRHADLERTLNRVGIMRKEAEPDINKEFAQAITQYRMQIEPILCYRDELYARLPTDFDAYVAALQDMYDRVVQGAPATEFWNDVSSSIRSWAINTKDTNQLRQLAGAIEKLQGVVKEERNKPYTRVGWQDSTNYTGLKWYPEQTISNDKSMEETVTWLREQATNPGGGLGFKLDDKEPKKK